MLHFKKFDILSSEISNSESENLLLYMAFKIIYYSFIISSFKGFVF